MIRIRFSMCHVQNHQDLVDQHTKVLLTCDWAQLCQRDSSKAPAPKSLLVTNWAANEQQTLPKLSFCWSTIEQLSAHHITNSLEQRAIQESKISSEICSAVSRLLSFWVQDLLSSKLAAQLQDLLSAALISHLPPLCSHQRSPTDWLRGGRVFSVSLRWLENTCNHSKLKDSLKMCICYLYTIDWMR